VAPAEDVFNIFNLELDILALCQYYINRPLSCEYAIPVFARSWDKLGYFRVAAL
jgi:hypothetical protein